jgi:hypothetical protein
MCLSVERSFHRWSPILMSARHTTILALALVAVSCNRGVSRVRTRPLPSPNPTTYSFPFPLEEVRTQALRAFSPDHQVHEPVFGWSESNIPLPSPLLAVESSSNAVFGEALFRDSANAHDLYLHSFHLPFAISPVYRGRAGGLPFVATFHLHLTMTGSNTLATVTAAETQVVNGTKWGLGPCGPGQGLNFQPVKPTTVVEYSILHYLGRYLRLTNMPAIILPSP